MHRIANWLISSQDSAQDSAAIGRSMALDIGCVSWSEPQCVLHNSLQEIVACFGQPVSGNPTQFMMERAFVQLGLDWRYLTLEVSPADLADAVRGARAMGFQGFNCTIPHKCNVLPLLDGLSQAAELIGAVNCVYRQADQFFGDNTDGKGFLESLKTLIDPQGLQIVVLGAGGAARAIAVELALAGTADLVIVNRHVDRGQELANLIREKTAATASFVAWDKEFEAPENARVVINATSIGLGDAAARVPLAMETLRPEMVIADVIFNPAQTRLLREARQRGCQTLDGLGMLVNQAATNFKIWTGMIPDGDTMRDALDEFLGV